MADFAKLFNVEGRQLLVYWAHDGDQTVLHQITHLEFGSVDAKAVFNEGGAERAFNALDDEKAAAVMREFINIEAHFSSQDDNDNGDDDV